MRRPRQARLRDGLLPQVGVDKADARDDEADQPWALSTVLG